MIALRDRRSDCNYLDDGLQAREVGWVTGIHGQLRGDRRRRDEEVDCAATSSFSPRADSRRVHASVCACRGCVERDRLEGGLGALKPILAAGALILVDRCVRASGQLCEGDRGHGDFRGERALGHVFDSNHDRRVDETARSGRFRHAG